MNVSAEQKARDLLERLSGATHYTDPQKLSAGDVVELAQLFAEIQRLQAELYKLAGSVMEISMPRNMSFMLTTEQIRNRTKTVTRRLGWQFLKTGDVLNACVKCQGLKPGETVERLCQIRVTSVPPRAVGDHAANVLR